MEKILDALMRVDTPKNRRVLAGAGCLATMVLGVALIGKFLSWKRKHRFSPVRWALKLFTFFFL